MCAHEATSRKLLSDALTSEEHSAAQGHVTAAHLAAIGGAFLVPCTQQQPREQQKIRSAGSLHYLQRALAQPTPQRRHWCTRPTNTRAPNNHLITSGAVHRQSRDNVYRSTSLTIFPALTSSPCITGNPVNSADGRVPGRGVRTLDTHRDRGFAVANHLADVARAAALGGVLAAAAAQAAGARRVGGGGRRIPGLPQRPWLDVGQRVEAASDAVGVALLALRDARLVAAHDALVAAGVALRPGVEALGAAQRARLLALLAPLARLLAPRALRLQPLARHEQAAAGRVVVAGERAGLELERRGIVVVGLLVFRRRGDAGELGLEGGEAREQVAEDAAGVLLLLQQRTAAGAVGEGCTRLRLASAARGGGKGEAKVMQRAGKLLRCSKSVVELGVCNSSGC